ncbi:hypothetical protein [uncultured Tenacibaculum sp.]|uniref:hypothetical protein n=1 Tax=uncultured Tenacibaculum sp. TaxID=174713 RepID=UPI002616A96B|nr:hypothetical protein [uncultured Tenacibaculum sp.]
MIRKILIGSALALGMYSFRKVKSTANALDKLKVKISGLNNVNISLKSIKLQIDLTLENHSNLDIGVKTFELIRIKKVDFYNKSNQEYIGSADVNISNIKIPAGDKTVIKNIPLKIPVKNLINNLSVFKGDVKNNLKIIIVLDTMGKEYALNTENFI